MYTKKRNQINIIQSISNDDEIVEFSRFIEKSGYDILELLEDLFDLSFAQETNIKNSPSQTTCLDLYWLAKTGLEENQIKLITIAPSIVGSILTVKISSDTFDPF